jgi:hypothetical protein
MTDHMPNKPVLPARAAWLFGKWETARFGPRG